MPDFVPEPIARPTAPPDVPKDGDPRPPIIGWFCRFPGGCICEPGVGHNSPGYREWSDRLHARGR